MVAPLKVGNLAVLMQQNSIECDNNEVDNFRLVFYPLPTNTSSGTIKINQPLTAR